MKYNIEKQKHKVRKRLSQIEKFNAKYNRSWQYLKNKYNIPKKEGKDIKW